MPNITNLQNKTHRVLDKFIEDITNFPLTSNFHHTKLLERTKKLFCTLDRLGMEEFAKIFKEYNFSSVDIKEHEKHYEILNFLIALVIEKYPQPDLLRYFLPENLSKKEERPEYPSNSSKVNYWFQLIGYWLRQLRNKPKYELNSENNQIAESIEYIKASFSKQAYSVNNTNKDFKAHLASLVKEIQKNAIHPNLNKINRENFTTNQEYHQALLEKDQALQVLERNLNEKNETITHHETVLSKKQQDFEERLQSLDVSKKEFLEEKDLFTKKKKEFEDKSSEERQSLKAEQETLFKSRQEFYENREILNEDTKEIEVERKKFDEDKKVLKEKILSLRIKLNEEKKSKDSYLDENYKLQKVLLDLYETFKKPIDELPHELLDSRLKKHNVELTDFQNSIEDNLSTQETIKSIPTSSSDFDVSLPSSSSSEIPESIQDQLPQDSRAVTAVSNIEKSPEAENKHNTQANTKKSSFLNSISTLFNKPPPKNNHEAPQIASPQATH